MCKITYKGGGIIDDFIPAKNFKFDEIKNYYKTVNIYKFSQHFSQTHYVPFLKAYQEALGRNEYYEQVLRVITMLDDPEIRAKELNRQKWYEIDDIQDLNIAESIFNPDSGEKVKLLQRRYGGYWRYPNMIDFCYLVNPFFPPRRLNDEIKANFDILIQNYPSGMEINSLLAAKNFGVHSENIILGNGAAEIIKYLMENFITGKTGFIRPSFEEYVNRYSNKDSVIFTPENNNYEYDSEDIINFFDGKNINNLIVINPDNPSGNYICKSGINNIISWTKEKNINFVLDESFADFSDEQDNTFIRQNILQQNPHVFVIKSISKSYGVPGLRLGVLACGNEKIIASMKKYSAIWNINSFAEFFMQIFEKYKKDYFNSLAKFRTERKRFTGELAKIKNLRVIPSQANFVMLELEEGIKSNELVKILLTEHNILSKDLHEKTGKNYLRFAIRNPEENDMLLHALREILQPEF